MEGRNNVEEAAATVLIVGAGAASLRAAIELTSRGVDCLVLGKRRHGDAHTRCAAGGINASFGHRDPEDRWDIHGADTLREGHFICQPRAVEILAREAPDRVRELFDWGCNFSVTDDGKIDQRYFGAQSFRRTCFAGDETGEAILRTLVRQAERVNVKWKENVFITRLLVDEGIVRGAVGFDMTTGKPWLFRSRAVVMAAGGFTSMYFRGSSRPGENTGDAPALAYSAGASLRDVEFVQFHPTGMIKPLEMRGRLVTEAVRGEGGVLRNASGERFMERYSPDKMELDARDIVARANYNEIQNGRGTPDGGVFLDISHKDRDFIRERLPRVYNQFLDQGIDIADEPMEVAPTAHYPMGGVAVDFDTGETGVPGLYAIGEATSGLHGANRLGGNSLAETVVFGYRTGRHLVETMSGGSIPGVADGLVADAMRDLRPRERKHGITPSALVDEIRHLLWKHAGIVRDGPGLREGVEHWEEMRARADEQCGWGEPGTEEFEWAMNLRFMLPLGEILLRAALMREESRGAHWRKDFQEENPAWRKNILARRDSHGDPEFWTEDIPPVPAKVESALAEHHELDYHHLE